MDKRQTIMIKIYKRTVDENFPRLTGPKLRWRLFVNLKRETKVHVYIYAKISILPRRISRSLYIKSWDMRDEQVKSSNTWYLKGQNTQYYNTAKSRVLSDFIWRMCWWPSNLHAECAFETNAHILRLYYFTLLYILRMIYIALSRYDDSV